jgi:hypothetical protein
MMLFSEEIKQGILEGNTYEFSYGWKFEKKPFLKDFMIDGFKKKAQAKFDGNDALETCCKLLINSGYGFFGYRWVNKR